MPGKISLKPVLNADRIREKGMFRFILEVGIIRFALPASILGKIIFYLLEYGWTVPNIGESLTERNICYFFVQVLMEGVIFGSILWFYGKQQDYPKLNQ